MVNFNTLRQRQNGRHFADDIFKCILVKEKISIAIIISLVFVPRVLLIIFSIRLDNGLALLRRQAII